MKLAARFQFLNRLAVAAAVALCISAGCGKPTPSATQTTADPAIAAKRGEEITEKMLAVYRKARSYTDHATYVQQAAYRGEGVERELPFFQMTLAFERPNKLRLTFEEAIAASAGRKGYDIASDGKQMRAAAVEIPGQLQESAAPAEITTENALPDPLIREAFAGRTLGDVFPQLAMLLDKDDASLVFPQDDSPRLLGKAALRDRECFRVSTNNPAGKRVFWIDCESYLLHRMELPIETQRKYLDAADQFSHLAVWIDFEEPTLDASIAAESFAIALPEGARLVRQFVAPPPAAPPVELGQPVAEFDLAPLKGDAVTHESLAGKTSLLDFWQIDCAPCKAHTPGLETVYQQLKDDDAVAIYAVNIEGPAAADAAVEATFRSWGSTMPILRDRTRASLERLKVNGTPTLMVVGPDGRLQYLHMGEHRDPAGLADLIRRVKEGGDLAAEARAEHQQLVANFEKSLDGVTIGDSPKSDGETSKEADEANDESADEAPPTDS